jgi:hypothetical protein
VERFLGTIGVGARPVRDERTSTMQSCVLITNDSDIFQWSKGVKGRKKVLFIQGLGDLYLVKVRGTESKVELFVGMNHVIKRDFSAVSADRKDRQQLRHHTAN